MHLKLNWYLHWDVQVIQSLVQLFYSFPSRKAQIPSKKIVSMIKKSSKHRHNSNPKFLPIKFCILISTIITIKNLKIKKKNIFLESKIGIENGREIRNTIAYLKSFRPEHILWKTEFMKSEDLVIYMYWLIKIHLKQWNIARNDDWFGSDGGKKKKKNLATHQDNFQVLALDWVFKVSGLKFLGSNWINTIS